MDIYGYAKRLGQKPLKKAVIAAMVVVLLASVAYLGRGVLRSDILPAYASHLHKNTLTEVTNKQQAAVNTALQPLGITFDHTTDDSCTLDIAISWSTAVYCNDEIDSDAHVSSALNDTSAQTQQANRAMHRLEWSGGTDSSGHYLLSYSKTIRGFDCQIQIFNDDTSSRLFCGQTFYYFGNPYNKL